MAKLTPVDYDPFSTQAQSGPTLTPVDYDPFKTEPGFFERVGEDFQKRKNISSDITDARMRGEQGIIESGLQQISKVGYGFANDLFNEGLKSAGSYISDITPEAVKRPLNSVHEAIYDSAPAETARGLVGQGMEFYEGLSPRTRRNIEGVANVLPWIIPVGGKTGTGEVVNATSAGASLAAKGAKKAVTKLDDALGETIRPTAQQLKTVSQANYATAAEKGGILSPEFTNKFLDRVDSYAPQNKWEAANSRPKLSTSLADDWKQFRDQSMTLEDATSIDRHLTDLLDDTAATDKNGILNAQGREILDIKNHLRQEMQKAADQDWGAVLGGREGLDAYKTAVKDWSAQSQISEVQRIIDRASYMDNPATSLKTGFRNIAVNPGRLSKYPKPVQNAIKQAAKDGDISNFLRTEWGSRLISGAIGTAAGTVAGPAGAILGGLGGLASSRASRNIAEKMQLNRANKVIDEIASTSSIPTTRISLSEKLKRNRSRKPSK